MVEFTIDALNEGTVIFGKVPVGFVRVVFTDGSGVGVVESVMLDVVLVDVALTSVEFVKVEFRPYPVLLYVPYAEALKLGYVEFKIDFHDVSFGKYHC